MTGFDYAVLALAAASAAVGALRGLAGELLVLAGWIAAFLAAQAGAGAAGVWLARWVNEPALQYVAGFALVFVAVLLAMSLLRLLLRRLIGAVGLGPADRFLGSLFGIARALVLVLALVLAAGLTDLPRRPWWREAALSPPLETAVLMAKPLLPAWIANRIRYRQAGDRPGTRKMRV
ncbi:MAG: CvpA family protein [Rhodocyclaceae bacterium]